MASDCETALSLVERFASGQEPTNSVNIAGRFWVAGYHLLFLGGGALLRGLIDSLSLPGRGKSSGERRSVMILRSEFREQFGENRVRLGTLKHHMNTKLFVGNLS